MKTPIKLSALSFGVALLMVLWAPSASAYDGLRRRLRDLSRGLLIRAPTMTHMP